VTTPTEIILVVEDVLSDVVMRKVVASAGDHLVVNRSVIAGGSGNIRSGLSKFRNASHVLPHVVVTDLDRYPCPPALLDDWGAVRLPGSLLFRVAVRETEAWLLADRDGLARMLGVDSRRIGRQPELESDPKRTLVNLARKCRRRRLRDELVPAEGSPNQIGPAFNVRMSQFVRDSWNVGRASAVAPSLARTIDRLATFPAR
jgi:hypothetical protein